jgi:hypothetical protein
MANIKDYLSQILKARYGKDVRQSIHDAIHQCYEDGKAGSVDLEARELIDYKVGYPDYAYKTFLGTGAYEGTVPEDGYVKMCCSKSELSDEGNKACATLYINGEIAEMLACEFLYPNTPIDTNLYPVKAGDVVKVSPVLGGGLSLECVFYPFR